jgi:outer membrane scaffolding protein for murein synthesis (MipA/OmpV family)
MAVSISCLAGSAGPRAASRALPRGKAHRRLTILLPLLTAMTTPGLAQAQAQPGVERPLWELGVGAAAVSLPHYRGAEKSRAWLLPMPYFVYRGEILRADREGLKLLLLDRERLHLDLSASATAPADSDDEPARHGMADLDGTLEIGPNLNWSLAQGPGWRLQARLPLRAALTLSTQPRAIGWSALPNLNLDRRVGGWEMGAQLGWAWGSRRLNGYFYDVGPGDVTPARAAYRAGSGHAGWQATLSFSRRDGARWIGAFVRADSLAGSALRHGPLVRRTNTFSFGIGVSWVLLQSGQLVRDRDELR